MRGPIYGEDWKKGGVRQLQKMEEASNGVERENATTCDGNRDFIERS